MKYTIPIAFAISILLSSIFAESPAVRTVGLPRELTTPDHFFIAPKWSPDGTTIAVSGAKYVGIYLISFPDGDIVTLTEDPGAGFGMEWSHGGEKIAARISRFENKRRYNAIAIFDVISGSRNVISDWLTLFPGTPKWTKNDEFIYISGTDKFKIYNTTSKNLRTKPISLPDEKVIFVKKDRINARDVSSQDEFEINAVEGRILNLTISPDGTMMAFEIMGGNLWVSDVDGKNPIDLGRGYAPAWHPNSDKIAYMVTTDDGHRYLSSDIYVVNADGTGKVNISNTPDLLEMHPAWSPDGKWIAYDTLNKGQIFVQEVR